MKIKSLFFVLVCLIASLATVRAALVVDSYDVVASELSIEGAGEFWFEESTVQDSTINPLPRSANTRWTVLSSSESFDGDSHSIKFSDGKAVVNMKSNGGSGASAGFWYESASKNETMDLSGFTTANIIGQGSHGGIGGGGASFFLQDIDGHGMQVLSTFNSYGYEQSLDTFTFNFPQTYPQPFDWTQVRYLSFLIDFAGGYEIDGDNNLVPVPAWFNYTIEEFNLTPVPEPSTYIAGALLLLPFAFSAIRQLSRKAKA